MKSEVRNLNEKTRDLPFPKLMINDKGTIILATCVEDGKITGSVVHEDKPRCGIGEHSRNWKDYQFKDLPEGVEVVLSNKQIKEGKCPKDGRENRPIFITIDGERTLAVADGKGDAYKVYGVLHEQYESKCLPENKYCPSEYEYERGLSGFDY